jgi:uncharacterized protein (DUF924 family)
VPGLSQAGDDVNAAWPAAADAVLRFWFDELSADDWFRKDPSLDRRIAERFGSTLAAATRCELFHWRGSARGRLAEVLVLDQFSRNIHRDTAAAFANDTLALALAQEAVARGCDLELPVPQRVFLYLPWMHSESALLHEQALRLFAAPGMERNLEFERRHKAIIDRFGRYPHRNDALGRTSTPEEIAFLSQPGSAF